MSRTHSWFKKPSVQVFELDRQLCDLPGQASPCQLFGIAEPPAGWADASREMNLCDGKFHFQRIEPLWWSILKQYKDMFISEFSTVITLHTTCPLYYNTLYFRRYFLPDSSRPKNHTTNCRPVPRQDGYLPRYGAHRYGIRCGHHPPEHCHVTGDGIFKNS